LPLGLSRRRSAALRPVVARWKRLSISVTRAAEDGFAFLYQTFLTARPVLRRPGFKDEARGPSLQDRRA